MCTSQIRMFWIGGGGFDELLQALIVDVIG